MADGNTNGGKRLFIASVEEVFRGAFKVWAKDEKEAKEIVTEDFFDEYSPANTGGGYERHVRIDPETGGMKT